jgi:hypothetical protein
MSGHVLFDICNLSGYERIRRICYPLSLFQPNQERGMEMVKNQP